VNEIIALIAADLNEAMAATKQKPIAKAIG
jgi:hypothetical protein